VTVVEQLGLVHRRVERLIRRRLAERTDRPFLQLRALRVIRGEELGTQAALAERLRIDAPAASRLIEKLVDDGLVRRRPGGDRRCVCLALTAKGRAAVAVLDEAIGFTEREVRRHLGAADARALGLQLRRLADGLTEQVA
jgi:MarR family transcriptional regulator for hemolysin